MTDRRSEIRPGCQGTRLPGVWIALTLLATLVTALVWRAALDVPAETAAAHWLEIRPQAIVQELGLMGRIEAIRREWLTAPFDGEISTAYVEIGERVSAGQALIALDPTDLDVQISQAYGQLLRAQRDVHRLQNWSASATVRQATRTLRIARANVEATQASLKDTRVLFERGIVARLEVDALSQRLSGERQDLEAAEESLHLAQAQGQGQELTLANLTLTNARNRHQALQAQRAGNVLRAPFAGIVSAVAALDGNAKVAPQAGTRVTRGVPLLAVIQQAPVRVVARVEEADVRLLRENMPVSISGEGFPGQHLVGHVSAISAQGLAPDELGAPAHYNLVVAVDDMATAMPLPRLGMSARLLIELYRNDHARVVPVEALRTAEDGSRYVLFRPTQDQPTVAKPVTVGRAARQGVEVHGLSDGFVRIR